MTTEISAPERRAKVPQNAGGREWLPAGHRGHTCVRRQGGAEALVLLPDLENDLAACVSARDPSQRLVNLAQWQDRFDLRA